MFFPFCILLLLNHVFANELSTVSNKITAEILTTAKNDLVPSLDWASSQIQAMIPTSLDNSSSTPKPAIRQALNELGVTVLAELKPGLEKCVLHLIQNHQSNPETKDKSVSSEELSLFISELTKTWSDALQTALAKWGKATLPKLLGFIGKLLTGIGKNILRKLGQLGNFLLRRGNKNQTLLRRGDIHEDIMDLVKDTCIEMTHSSLKFLTGPGWQSFVISEALKKNDPSTVVLKGREKWIRPNDEDFWKIDYNSNIWED